MRPLVLHRSRAALAGLALLALACMASCGKASAPSGPDAAAGSTTAAAAVSSAQPAPPAPPKPSMAGRVFVDTSQGMKGFAGPSIKVAGLRDVHLQIDLAMSEAGAPGAKRCTLGATIPVCTKTEERDGGKVCTEYGVVANKANPVACPDKVPDWGNTQTYLNETSGAEEILVRKPRPAVYNVDRPPPPDYLDDAGLTVMVLSGFEKGATTAAAGTSAADICKEGPSPACIAASLTERVREGFGVWLTALYMLFDGAFIADAPIDPGFLARPREHLKALKEVTAGATSRYAGIEFNIGPQKPIPGQPPTVTSIQYKGVRPLLILAFSRDFDKGRRFMNSLTDRLRRESAILPGKMTGEDAVHSIELGPVALPTYEIESIEKAAPGPPPMGQGAVDPVALNEFRLESANPEGGVSIANISCGTKGKSWVIAKIAQRAPAAPLPDYLQTSTLLRGPRSEFGQIDQVCKFEQPQGLPAFRIFVRCEPLGVRPHPWPIEFELRRKVSLDQAQADKAWWADLSTDRLYEMPERVYGVRQVVLTLLNQVTAGDADQGRIRLNVRRIE
jgi:hypothetical protein